MATHWPQRNYKCKLKKIKKKKEKKRKEKKIEIKECLRQD
jgi:hypothetical protein